MDITNANTASRDHNPEPRPAEQNHIAYRHTSSCSHTPPPTLAPQFTPLSGRAGIVIYNAPDAVATVGNTIGQLDCPHMLTMLASTTRDLKFSRKRNADFIGFVGNLDDDAYAELSSLGATGHVVLVPAAGEPYEHVKARMTATVMGPYVAEFARG